MRAPHRRQFLHDTAALAASLAAIPAGTSRAGDDRPADSPADTKPGSPNEVLRVAVVGVRGRGMDHIAGFGHLKKDVRITTICDVDANVIGPAKKELEHLYGGATVSHVQDIRRVLDDKSIDAISVATPNH